MFNNKIVYFAEEPFLSAIKAAYNAIWVELNTQKAIEFENNNKILNSDEHDDEYQDDEMLVGLDNLHEIVQNWCECLDLNPATLFLTENDISNQIQEAIKEKSDKAHFDINLTVNSDQETLFHILYATKIDLKLCDSDDNQKAEFYLEYSDFDYSDFQDIIESAFKSQDSIESADFSHVGGENWDNQTSVDLYYAITYK